MYHKHFFAMLTVYLHVGVAYAAHTRTVEPIQTNSSMMQFTEADYNSWVNARNEGSCKEAGRGAFACVVVRTDSDSNEKVAVKGFDRETNGKSGPAHEAKMTRAAEGPGVIELLHEFTQTPPALIFEFAEGGDLLEPAVSEDLLLSNLPRIVFNMMQALHTLRNAEIVHSDIKLV